MNTTRRNFMKLGTLAFIPLVPAVSFAAKNEPSRTALKYKDTPEGDKKCKTCMHFVDNKGAKNNSCKLIPNDTEISTDGYCTVWTKKV